MNKTGELSTKIRKVRLVAILVAATLSNACGYLADFSGYGSVPSGIPRDCTDWVLVVQSVVSSGGSVPVPFVAGASPPIAQMRVGASAGVFVDYEGTTPAGGECFTAKSLPKDTVITWMSSDPEVLNVTAGTFPSEARLNALNPGEVTLHANVSGVGRVDFYRCLGLGLATCTKVSKVVVTP